MNVRIRPAVAALPAYVPGRARRGSVKLSSNENPEPPHSAVLAAGRAALDGANRYPDMAAVALREAIADLHGVTPESVCVGTGSSAILLAALSAVCTPGSRVVFPWRSFESYPIAVPTSGGESVPVPLTRDWRVDLEAMSDAVGEDTAAVIVCSPNNPTGPALGVEEIRSFVERVPRDVLVLIDEAYIEYATEPGVQTCLPLVSAHPNVLVLRTFSKAYALAGLRVGYGIGHPELVAAVSMVLVPFGVSSVAQAAALAALADPARLANSVAATVAERGRVVASLRSLGYEVPDSQSNFVWIPAEQSGPGFVEACTEAGLIVRPFPEGVRVSLGTREEDDRFLEVARSVITPH